MVDIQLPPNWSDEGIRAAEAIRRDMPDIGILVLSTYVEPAYAYAVASIGTQAIGYLVKDRVTSIETLLYALGRIQRRECVIDPEVVQALLGRARRKPAIATLTPREKSILQLMAEGRSNNSIAKELSLAVRTVEANTAAIFNKLDLPEDPAANRRVQAVLTWLHGR